MEFRPILVVEDHALTASLIRELLQGFYPAHALHVATTASQGFSEFVRLRPSLMVMDIGLPDGSGLDVTRRVAAADPALAVVVYSSGDGSMIRGAAAAAGACAFVSKSNPGELVAVIKKLLGSPPDRCGPV